MVVIAAVFQVIVSLKLQVTVKILGFELVLKVMSFIAREDSVSLDGNGCVCVSGKNVFQLLGA